MHFFVEAVQAAADGEVVDEVGMLSWTCEFLWLQLVSSFVRMLSWTYEILVTMSLHFVCAVTTCT